MTTIERLESNVRSYCRAFPTTFARASGSWLYDEEGRRYLDFFAGAGALNYGHNPAVLKDAIVEHIGNDGIVHALDMTTTPKVALIEAFDALVLQPRRLSYKFLFPGPTGTNAIEVALKIARRATGRTNVVAFTNAFHGMTLGALAATGNARKRAGAGVPLPNVTRIPFAGFGTANVDGLDALEALLADGSSGVDVPAAIVVETVQAEGGINVAPTVWLRRLERIAKAHGIILIVDDIQVGCGRTGPFFSFERAGIVPDVVCLSKSLSGFGLPMSLVLLSPELDVLEPGEHNGTFRGHNLAFVTARVALETWWKDDAFTADVDRKAEHVASTLRAIADEHGAHYRGRGLIQGIAFDDPALAERACSLAFERGLVIETAGSRDEVIKVLAPLTTTIAEFDEGLGILTKALRDARRQLGDRKPAARASASTPPANADIRRVS